MIKSSELIRMVKWKQSGKVDFFWKKSEDTVSEVLDFESNNGIFGSLAPFDGELWRFESCATPTAYAKFFLENVFFSGRVKNSTCTRQVFIDFHSYNYLE